MSLPRVLDEEFKRVAREEEKTMEELVSEVAALTNYTPRQLYNFRSGKWPLPAELIPFFCMRFKSRAVLNALIAICEKIPVKVPESLDIARLSSQVVREDLRHYETLLDAFEDGVITRAELDALEESGDKVIQNICITREIVRTNYERKQASRERR